MISKQQRLLAYRASELTVLPRGKGLKLMRIPGSKLKQGTDGIRELNCLQEGEGLTIYAGKRKLKLQAQDIIERLGVRDRAGENLPSALPKVEYTQIIPKVQDGEENNLAPLTTPNKETLA